MPSPSPPHDFTLLAFQEDASNPPKRVKAECCISSGLNSSLQEVETFTDVLQFVEKCFRFWFRQINWMTHCADFSSVRFVCAVGVENVSKQLLFFLSFFWEGQADNLQTRCLASHNVNMHKATDAAHVRSPGTCFFPDTAKSCCLSCIRAPPWKQRPFNHLLALWKDGRSFAFKTETAAAATCNLWFCQQQRPKLVVGACSISMYKKYFYCTGGRVKVIWFSYP